VVSTASVVLKMNSAPAGTLVASASGVVIVAEAFGGGSFYSPLLKDGLFEQAVTPARPAPARPMAARV
jgi:hypothetical protein